MQISHVKDVYSFLNESKQKGFSIIGATLDGKPPSKVDGKKILVLGSEGEGLPNRMNRWFDLKFTIPFANRFDSLNVSVAGGILIDRITR
jgi:23S rRNA (guanosine2251-2'-O)-methyltransferase